MFAESIYFGSSVWTAGSIWLYLIV